MRTKKFIPLLLFFFLVMPASTNFKLKDYSFGSGGTSGSTAGGFSLEAITGQTSGAKASGGGFSVGPGLIFLGQANVPVAPTFTNPSNYYNKLQLIVNPSGNPTDTKFAIAISTDNFATITNYVQSDNTVGPVLGAEDYQIYSAWGGASGITVIGLTASTTFQVKVKAMQGKFSETGFGPTASAATVTPQLSFSITTDLTSVSPFVVNFGTMVPNTVNNSSPHQINIAFATNGVSGGRVYVSGTNAGLYSVTTNHKIAAVSGDLSSLTEGFGAQGINATQTSGGPLTTATIYGYGGGDCRHYG
jgi:hypothetical protein